MSIHKGNEQSFQKFLIPSQGSTAMQNGVKQHKQLHILGTDMRILSTCSFIECYQGSLVVNLIKLSSLNVLSLKVIYKVF